MVQEIRNKIHRLKSDYVYTYDSLKGIKKDGTLRSTMARLEEQGEIFRVGRGKFYKPARFEKIPMNEETVVFTKKDFRFNAYWSAPDGKEVPVSQLIRKYISDPSDIEDLSLLYWRFGARRLVHEAREFYRSLYKSAPQWKKDPAYSALLDRIKTFESWRLNDSRG